MPDPLLTMRNMCDLYQVTRYTICAGTRPDCFPPIRVSRTLRWNRDEVAAALKAAAERN